MEMLIGKILEYDGPVEKFKQSGLTFIYLSQDLKENKEIVIPENVAHSFFAPITDEFIIGIEKENQMVFSNLYKEQLKDCNGFSLNLGHLTFLGLDLGLWKGFTQKEKWFLGKDIVTFNKFAVPKKIADRYLIIGEDFTNNCWLGIREEKTYTINRYGKQLSEIDLVDYCIAAVDEFNMNADEVILDVKKSYQL